jgi:hypothetical protein
VLFIISQYGQYRLEGLGNILSNTAILTIDAFHNMGHAVVRVPLEPDAIYDLGVRYPQMMPRIINAIRVTRGH